MEGWPLGKLHDGEHSFDKQTAQSKEPLKLEHNNYAQYPLYQVSGIIVVRRSNSTGVTVVGTGGGREGTVVGTGGGREGTGNPLTPSHLSFSTKGPSLVTPPPPAQWPLPISSC